MFKAEVMLSYLGLFCARSACGYCRGMDPSLLTAIPVALFTFVLSLLLLEHLDCVTTADDALRGSCHVCALKVPGARLTGSKEIGQEKCVVQISLLGAVHFLMSSISI